MNIEKELRDAILRLGAVTDLVVARVWDEWFRNERLPAIVYEIDSETEQNGLDGRSDMILAEANIICRAKTRKESRELAEAVRTNGTSPASGLAGWFGRTGATAVTDRGGVDVIDRAGNRVYAGRDDDQTYTFTAWLEDKQTAAVPRVAGGNEYWYDTNMSFGLQWREAMR